MSTWPAKGDPENAAYGLGGQKPRTTSSPADSSRSIPDLRGALDAADRAFRFKSAIQELARQTTSWPCSWPNRSTMKVGPDSIFTSTWDDAGQPLFDDPKTNDGLSRIAKSAIAGVLAHAPALAAVSNPTINSQAPVLDTLAPWLIDWGLTTECDGADPAGARQGIPHGLRLGDASANPYLAIAGLLAAAYLGIRDKLEPPPPLEGYGYDPSKADKPGDLRRHSTPSRPTPTWPGILGKQFAGDLPDVQAK